MKVLIGIFLFSMAFTRAALAQGDLEAALGENDFNDHEKVTATFKSGHLINGHSIETVYKRELEVRIDHRFGDIAGDNGGISRFFGLDQAADVRFGFDYGISDRLTIGIGRTKGATAITQLYDGSLKYRLWQQTVDQHVPISVTLYGSTTVTGVEASTDPTSATAYSGFKDRLTYVVQALIARKFSEALSLQLSPTYLHRNFTAFNDQNDLLALGIGGRVKVSRHMALVADYFLTFRDRAKKEYLEAMSLQSFYNALGVGLEIETGGHVFHLNFTNATAIQEMQFIPETTSSWGKGQFRWGFSLSRRFSFSQRGV